MYQTHRVRGRREVEERDRNTGGTDFCDDGASTAAEGEYDAMWSWLGYILTVVHHRFSDLALLRLYFMIIMPTFHLNLSLCLGNDSFGM